MPNFDRTGPQGMGPRTGRGMGPCGGFNRGGFGRGCVNRFFSQTNTEIDKNELKEYIAELKEELKAAEEY